MRLAFQRVCLRIKTGFTAFANFSVARFAAQLRTPARVAAILASTYRSHQKDGTKSRSKTASSPSSRASTPSTRATAAAALAARHRRAQK